MSELDHLVYAVPALDRAVDEFEVATGVRPAFGGAHPGIGTHNALVSLGDCYLELIAPDPDQPDPDGPRPFGIDELAGRSRLATFAVRPVGDESIEGLVAAARESGHDAGDPIPMSRVQPGGIELRWRLTFPTAGPGAGLVPFVIDWGDTPNPALTAPGGVELAGVAWAHPEPAPVERARVALGFDEPVDRGAQARISAELRGPAGALTL